MAGLNFERLEELHEVEIVGEVTQDEEGNLQNIMSISEQGSSVTLFSPTKSSFLGLVILFYKSSVLSFKVSFSFVTRNLIDFFFNGSS